MSRIIVVSIQFADIFFSCWFWFQIYQKKVWICLYKLGFQSSKSSTKKEKANYKILIKASINNMELARQKCSFTNFPFIVQIYFHIKKKTIYFFEKIDSFNSVAFQIFDLWSKFGKSAFVFLPKNVRNMSEKPIFKFFSKVLSSSK